MFFVNAFIYNSLASKILVKVNGNKIMGFNDKEDVGNPRQQTFFFTYELKKDDELWLENYYENTVHVKYDTPLTFLGYLM